MLDLRRLEILHRFAARGTITATAADLGYSPSAISQQLAALEREVGVALIERTAQRASLTDAGRELAEHAARILAAAETAHSRMRARIGTVSGRVTVSCIHALAPALAPHLAALQRTHPELNVVAHETGSTTAAAAVLDRRYDLAVIDDWSAHPPTEGTGLSVHRLRREDIVLAIPADHPLTEQPSPATAARLRQIVHNQTWLCAPIGQLSRAAGDRYLTAINATPPRRWEFEGLHILAALVATGAGVAFLPAGLAHEQAGVAGLRLAPRMQRTILALTRTTTQEDPAITACLHAAQRALSSRH
ncbi:LysR family transcriptional regulator [Streptomyces sp. NWU339]|uniref:LysR family transcriptional regulator n=1 Tax=Streptomyces sp. NWU339 TaxID=2185284 RepID=UPI000D68523B|nr:LysR family transcriptional regulator [Streptomyces sp. NWU339]PWI12280.1 LysR family transcriptional regulator [Streptomyces sp. NWU339]